MKGKNLNNFLFLLTFSLIFVYYEIVFKIFTKTAFSFFNFLFCVLFGLFFGGINYLLSSVFKSQKINKIISCVLIGLSSVAYLVEFFVFKQFKIFYDLKTIFIGASDALKSYTKETFTLIFSFQGICAIFLFLLPTIIYIIFLNRILISAAYSNFAWRIKSALLSIFSLVLILIIIGCNSVLRAKITTEYNYQNSIEQFGLLPSVYLDLKNIVIPQNDKFISVDSKLSQEDENIIIEEKPPQKNELDINFNPENKTASNDILYLNNYVSSLTASEKNEYTGIFKGKNLIFITAEAFSKPVINKDLTPTLYRLSTKGINFLDYYQTNESGTTGGEYQNIFGMLPTSGGSSFKNTQNKYNYFTIGSQLDRLGYYGKAYHNNSYTYYSRHLTHNNIGYSDGFMGYGNGMEQYVEKAWPQSDYEMISGTLPTYINKEKFNIYYMSVSGHNNYTIGENSMTKRHWDKVKDLPYSNVVKGYLAANLDLEAAVTHLVEELEKNKLADDTVIVISPDHFPYGLSSDRNTGINYLEELYGYDINSCFDRDITSLIIWSGSLEKEKPIIVSEPTSSIDILPTLSNLFGTEFDSRLMVGRDVFSDTQALVFYANYSFKTSLGTYYSNTGKFVPLKENTTIPEGYVNQIKTIIKNKIKFCADSQKTDYFRYLFE